MLDGILSPLTITALSPRSSKELFFYRDPLSFICFGSRGSPRIEIGWYSLRSNGSLSSKFETSSPFPRKFSQFSCPRDLRSRTMLSFRCKDFPFRTDARDCAKETTDDVNARANRRAVKYADERYDNRRRTVTGLQGAVASMRLIAKAKVLKRARRYAVNN